MRARDLWSYRRSFSFIAHLIEQDLITLDGPAHAAKRQRMMPSFRLDMLDRQAAGMHQSRAASEGRRRDRPHHSGCGVGRVPPPMGN